jgi:hypothetical protein
MLFYEDKGTRFLLKMEGYEFVSFLGDGQFASCRKRSRDCKGKLVVYVAEIAGRKVFDLYCEKHSSEKEVNLEAWRGFRKSRWTLKKYGEAA